MYNWNKSYGFSVLSDASQGSLGFEKLTVSWERGGNPAQ
jgi:hypothetical protein